MGKDLDLHELLLTPWTDEHRARIESHFGLPLPEWFAVGTPGPFVVKYEEHMQTFVPKFDFFPMMPGDGKAIPTGFVDRSIRVVKVEKTD
jgi:hypothetical protein